MVWVTWALVVFRSLFAVSLLLFTLGVTTGMTARIN
jgi:hypothetical protein